VKKLAWISAGIATVLGSASAEPSAAAPRVLGEIPGGARLIEWNAPLDDRRIRVTAIVFSSSAYRVRVVDNPPDSQRSVASFLAAGGAVAGVNGGYFHDDFRPVGMQVSDGKTLNSFERAKLLSGILTVRSGKFTLTRSNKFKNTPAVDAALQAGPWLVDDATAAVGLNATRPARRTVVATDGHGRWAFLTMASVTLADAARLLAGAELTPGFVVRDALNMDGGSSTALWAKTSSGIISQPEFGFVRNAIAIVPIAK
jgi:uncharacterized protein YigE (DUF2233 family)